MLTQNQISPTHSGRPSWDLDEMVDRVRRTLHEEVDPLTIRHTLVDILASYEDVPVQIFVPIFACRDAEEALRKKHLNSSRNN